MVDPLFRQSFLYDALVLDRDIHPGQMQLSSGACVNVLGRGLVEVVPPRVTEETKHIILSAGIHGDETAPMELLDLILADILNETVAVKEHCLFMLCHPEATAQHSRYIDENLNRLFNKEQKEQSKEMQISQVLKSVVQGFFESVPESNRWHLDMHSSIRQSHHYTFAVSPKVKKPTRSRELISFLQKGAVEAVLLANAPASTFSWFSAEHFGAQALTVELGRVAPLGQNDLIKLTSFELALRGLITAELSHLEEQPIETYRVTQTIKRMSEDFGFNFAQDVENFTTFEHGQVLGHDGEKLLFAKSDDEAVVFANDKVAIGQRAALMVCKVETRYEEDQIVYD
ncbi:succinylglutamate desuccinylase [Vibrio albus]|uniref:Succinylglutamate desuccinylase n=1 Tax=Vibrio albus TaxID=2200953 RepID=A0A2U3BDH1_9VIBR|nr:succinylglutamate desuccinylase [Vibrio albus]PWI34820.1 succinylglutamate desuccinylase [Vibrio albus]